MAATAEQIAALSAKVDAVKAQLDAVKAQLDGLLPAINVNITTQLDGFLVGVKEAIAAAKANKSAKKKDDVGETKVEGAGDESKKPEKHPSFPNITATSWQLLKSKEEKHLKLQRFVIAMVQHYPDAIKAVIGESVITAVMAEKAADWAAKPPTASAKAAAIVEGSWAHLQKNGALAKVADDIYAFWEAQNKVFTAQTTTQVAKEGASAAELAATPSTTAPTS